MKNGNILEAIWLNKDKIEKAYAFVNRMDIQQIHQTLISLLENYQFNQTWIEQYRKDMLFDVKHKHKINPLSPFPVAEDLLKVLREIDKEEEILKRVLSIRCFGDSKYFEKKIEHLIIRIIKKYVLDEEGSQEEENKEDILLKVGISKYPEILEFCGDLECIIQNQKIEYKKETIRKLYQ